MHDQWPHGHHIQDVSRNVCGQNVYAQPWAFVIVSLSRCSLDTLG